jgi:uncharacterized protein YoxC
MSLRRAVVVVGVMALLAAAGAAVFLGFKLNSAEDRLSEQSELVSRLKDQISASATQADELKESQTEYRSQAERLAKQNRRLENEVKELTDQVDSLQEDLQIAEAEPVVSECGDLVSAGAGVYDITAEDVACSSAVEVARAWWESGQTPGYTCESTQVEYEVSSVTCTNSTGATVVFSAGA